MAIFFNKKELVFQLSKRSDHQILVIEKKSYLHLKRQQKFPITHVSLEKLQQKIENF